MSKKITSSSYTSPLKSFSRLVLKFHYMIFILIILSGVAYTVYKINVILNIPTDQAYKIEKEKVLLNDSFDQDTILKLKQLKYSKDPQSLSLPPGRTNPFNE